MLQESFFGKGERPYDETAEDSKTANKKKAAFKRKYQESYLNYGLMQQVIHIFQAHFAQYVMTGYAMKP